MSRQGEVHRRLRLFCLGAASHRGQRAEVLYYRAV